MIQQTNGSARALMVERVQEHLAEVLRSVAAVERAWESRNLDRLDVAMRRLRRARDSYLDYLVERDQDSS